MREGSDIIEPAQWGPADDKRVPVLDPNTSPPRVIRYVGWRLCLRCGRKFFSRDVVAVRMCQPCKDGHKAEDW